MVQKSITRTPLIIAVADIGRIIIPNERINTFDLIFANQLAEQMRQSGHQHTPITLDIRDQANTHYKGKWHLVAGRHRLHALKQLGWDIRAELLAQGEDAEQVEIEENLLRQEMSALAKVNHIGAWHDWAKKRGMILQQGGDRNSKAAKTAFEKLPTLSDRFQLASTGIKPLKETQIKVYKKVYNSLCPNVKRLLAGTPWASKLSVIKHIAQLKPAAQATVVTELMNNPKANIKALLGTEKPPTHNPEKQQKKISNLLISTSPNQLAELFMCDQNAAWAAINALVASGQLEQRSQKIIDGQNKKIASLELQVETLIAEGRRLVGNKTQLRKTINQRYS